eukprot:scaffold132_cov170-Amphora_coffeaeformis.AAC.20
MKRPFLLVFHSQPLQCVPPKLSHRLHLYRATEIKELDQFGGLRNRKGKELRLSNGCCQKGLNRLRLSTDSCSRQGLGGGEIAYWLWATDAVDTIGDGRLGCWGVPIESVMVVLVAGVYPFDEDLAVWWLPARPRPLRPIAASLASAIHAVERDCCEVGLIVKGVGSLADRLFKRDRVPTI